ncbi:MAG: hypothetical protein V3U54_07595 [Thermodesulfobacteriota bacterium]
MVNNRGVGIATAWLKEKHHSYVRVTDIADDGKFTINFQNEKFETKSLTLDARELITRARLESFMGV